MKIYQAMVKYNDGSTRPVSYDCFTTTLHARLAASIVNAMAGVNQIHEGDERLSPKAIATRACDIAHQLIEEFERREWIIELPEVVPPVTVGESRD